jgi:hypothetical protein
LAGSREEVTMSTNHGEALDEISRRRASVRPEPAGRRSSLRLLLAGAAAASSIAASSPAESAENGQLGRQPLDRALQRPAAQYHVDGSSSAIETTIDWPCAFSQAFLDFDFMIDSELGYDFLRVFVDNEPTPRAAYSGSYSAHAQLDVGCGTHTVRFVYVKDGSVTVGADTAVVDNVVAGISAGVQRMDRFDDAIAAPYVPSGWTATGYAGGWRVTEPLRARSVRRPIEQYHLDDSRSWMDRLVWVPDGPRAEIVFDYFVDSEQNYDFLDVYDNGSLAFQASGHQVGRKALSLAPLGWHVLRFEYLKDSSVSVGLDMARVDNVRFLLNGIRTEAHTFDGSFWGVLGGCPPGWSCGSDAAGVPGWVTSAPSGHKTWVPRQQLATEPVADGFANLEGGAEYPKSATAFSLRDWGAASTKHATAILLESDASEALFVHLRVPARTSAVGDEQGVVVVYLDALHDETMRGAGCSPLGLYPRQEDRRVEVNYSIPTGSQTGTVQVYQKQGTCHPAPQAWSSIRWGGNLWPVLAGVAEPSPGGWVTIELKIVLRPAESGGSEPLASAKLGLGIAHEVTGAQPPSRQALPYRDGSGPVEDDVSTWETVIFRAPAAGDESDNLDGCCAPRN